MNINKVLLLNPPGSKLYIRDLFCSKISKTRWLNHPVDLLMLSGRLSQRYAVEFIDAIAENCSPAECSRRIEMMAPDSIIWLTGVVSYKEDFTFIKNLKKRMQFVSVALGDIFFENGEGFLKENDFIDAILYDYVSEDILHYFSEEFEKLCNISYRHNGRVTAARIIRSNGGQFSLPAPRHDLFLSSKYIFPFIRKRPFATVLTDFGCLHNCGFCIMGTLGYKYRPVPDVMEELLALRKLGVREIFFADQTWGSDKARALELCAGMERRGLRFGWLCLTRVDTIDKELLGAMKRSGCHTIIFGVESADAGILKKYNKGYTRARIKEAFALAHSFGIETVGTFIMGLPEETRETFLATLRFAEEIECGYYSFNVAVPRPGTRLRAEALENKLISCDPSAGLSMDQGGSFVSMPTYSLSTDEVNGMIRKVLFAFYFRPSYLLKRLFKVKSLYQLYVSILQMLEIAKKIVRRS